MTNHKFWQLIGLTLLTALAASACSSGLASGGTALPEVPLMEGPDPELQISPDSGSHPEGSTQTADAGRQPDADVLFVEAVDNGGRWTFSVTISHPDTGWRDYADGWDVVLPDGTVLKADPESPFTRVLLHPHENEQPFRRGQSGLIIPAGVERVTVRAHDLVNGFGGQEIALDLTSQSGGGYRVIRPGNDLD